ncbi:hypothetical protein [Shewanella aquimarina]|uniref:hypothetical protein n=1 Tax=Shewanella aquimarina TaxID=260365 RepID=UPI002014CDDE|nr:hypothetical protein [Shewanella aquimarina]MCL2911745.1 hypothetical protein [Shewanella aquimarina]
MKIFIGFMLIAGSFIGCYGDRVISNLLFENYCSEEGRTGQYIYERVGLGEEYFLSIPKDPREVNFHFVVDSSLMINRELLEKDYIFSDYQESIPLSIIGPVYSLETSVIRKSDGKLLGKSISLFNSQGWLAELNILGQNEGDSCPRGYDKELNASEIGSLHSTLYKKIFYRK